MINKIDIRNIIIAMQSVMVENTAINPLTSDSVSAKIEHRAMIFEQRMNEISKDYETSSYTYKSTASHIKMSCYNCLFFSLGDDMIQGTCKRKRYPTPKVSGIGTCDDFTYLAG